MNRKLKKELNLVPHFNVSDSIPILSVSDDNSIFEVRKGLYSKTYALQDVNFQTAKLLEKGQMAKAYGSFLDALDVSQRLQITIINRLITGETAVESAYIPEVGDDLDYLRTSYNQIIKRNMEAGRNNIRKEKYFTLSQECTDMIAAEKHFAMDEAELLTHIRDVPGADLKGLSLIKRINLLRGLYNPGSDKEYQEYAYINGRKVKAFTMDSMYKRGVSVSELVQPASMEFRNGYFCHGPGVYGAALDLDTLPRIIKDSFLTEMTNVNFNMILSMTIQQIEKGEAYRLVDRKLTNLEGDYESVANRGGVVPHRLRKNEEEVDQLLDDISTKDQNLFDVKMHIVLFARSREELNDHIEKIRTLARSKGVNFKLANGLQEQSFTSTLPFGFDCTGVFRTLTTDTVAGLTPFSVQELQINRGRNTLPISYGINKISKSLITYDRYLGDSYNGFIFGFVGSGKSMTAKWSILASHLSDPDCDTFIIDPQAEYTPLVQALKGQVIDVIGSGSQRINPFDIDVDYGDDGQDPVASKINFIISMVQIMVGTNLPLTGIQKAALTTAGKQMYEPWLRNDKKPEFIPTMDDLYDAIMRREDTNRGDIYELAQTIGLYTKRQGVDVIFADQTNVNIHNRLVAYNIQDLGDSLKPLAMLIILDAIWVRICRNRNLKRRTYLYIDEIHLLFQNENVAEFLKKIWKVVRKYWGAPTGITQNVEDVLTSPAGRAIINNSAFIIMLKQSEMDRRALTELFNLSDSQLSYISNSRAGEGLIRVDASQNLPMASIIPFQNQIPEDTDIFKLITTKIVKDEDD